MLMCWLCPLNKGWSSSHNFSVFVVFFPSFTSSSTFPFSRFRSLIKSLTYFFLFGFYNSTCFGRSFASIIRSNTNCSSSHWCVSLVRGRINPVSESLAVCIIFHGSMGLMAWWCTLWMVVNRCAMYNAVVPPFQIGISSESLCIGSISCRTCMASLDSMWAGCPCALCCVAFLPITLYQSGPAYHYLVVCSVVRGLNIK